METLQSLFPEWVKKAQRWVTQGPRRRWLILVVFILINCVSLSVGAAFDGVVQNLSWRALERQALPWLRGTMKISNWAVCLISALVVMVIIALTTLAIVLSARLKAIKRTSPSLWAQGTPSYLWLIQWFEDKMVWPTIERLVRERDQGRTDASLRFAHACFQFIMTQKKELKVVFVKNITILRPDLSDPEWLTIWKSFHEYSGIREATRLYIGDNQEREDLQRLRGMRGRVFLTGESKIVNILSREEWKADDGDFEPPHMSVPCPYDAFLAVRISAGEEGPVGILCVEVDPSIEIDAFHLQLFESIGCRIAWGIRLLELSS